MGDERERSEPPASEGDEQPAAPEREGCASPSKHRWPKRLVMIVAGLLVGLVMAEMLFRWRDGGAFPHLNAYVADESFGVRLEPGFEGSVRVGSGAVTSYRINQQGFRGVDLPAATERDVVVLGDSQVFGLGVEEEETFASRLAGKLGRPVINAGVPTYGPPEYHQLAERLLEERPGATSVYVVNVANDLFEARRPNRERHAEWDGWAVRKETAPLKTTRFPGRTWLYRHSHLVFAWRKLWCQQLHPELDDAAFPSEGGWQDLVDLGGAEPSRA